MSKVATRRLTKEYKSLEEEPVEFVKAVRPLEDNLHECHFCVSLSYTFLYKHYVCRITHRDLV